MYDANEGQLTNSVTVPPIYPSNPSSPATELPPVPSRSPSLNSYVPSALSQSPFVGFGSPAFPPVVSPPKANIYAVRTKPGFTFLPLMDSPAPSAPTTPAPSVCSLPATFATPTPPSSEADDSDHDLSTPALSNASLDTTPSPREHPLELEGADSYFQLSPRLVTKKQKELNNPYFPPSSAYPSSTGPTCYTPGPTAPGVQFKRMLGTPFRPPPNPVTPQEDDGDDEEGDFMIINGEKCHFGPSSTPPDSPLVGPAQEHDEVPLSPISPAQTTSALFALDSAHQTSQSPSQDLPPSISRAPPAPSIPVAPAPGAYASEPVIAPFCMQMKRRGAAIPL
ncbi:hypothetical protein FIBSPDRAFT_869515 [Athelia psychrophila]|uniref:Uncharacterized protein n=1 Tax=Athelia psychrophila TaxID=1759441 RepID=A0A166C251_9AGAM|nr:hypothetical protein FIBSPDRAFT_869515 [Fibularhizoctonia sp. CBS 109695]